MSSTDVRTADVVIVGGGAIGCSIAWQLTQRGLTDVVLLERRSLASGATGVCPGGVRQQFEGEADCLWARWSVKEFWEQINPILEPAHPFHFERSGYLFLAHSEELLQRFAGNVALQNGLGIPSLLVSPEEAADIVPGLHRSGLVGGAFCAEDGFLEDCHGITNLLAQRAEERGARVLIEEAVRVEALGPGWQVTTRPAPSGGKSKAPSVQAHAGPGDGSDASATLHCERVVLAAGVDSVPLAADLGVELPIVAQRRRLAFTVEHGERVMPPLVVAPALAFAGKQLESGGFYIGWLGETGEEPELVFTEKALAGGAALLPLFADLPVRRVLAGTYDTTPDHRPIVGEVDGYPGLFVAAGFSGHGFMIAPAVGASVAGAIVGEPPELPMGPFLLSRFADASSDDGEGLVI